MKLTTDEQRALSFTAALLLVSAAVRLATLPEPMDVPASPGFDADAHLAATARAVAEEERRRRPLAEGERLDPNAAPAEELDRLPGVGPAVAERIVAARDERPFRSAADLTRVRGIGERTVERLAPFLEFPASTGSRWAADSRRAARSSGPARDVGATASMGSGGVVNVNRASASALMELRGVGPVLAERIVAYRDSAGPFPAVDSLVAVPGIGPATLERFRARVRVR